MPPAIKPQTLDILWMWPCFRSFWSKGARHQNVGVCPNGLMINPPCVFVTFQQIILVTDWWTELRFFSDATLAVILCERRFCALSSFILRSSYTDIRNPINLIMAISYRMIRDWRLGLAYYFILINNVYCVFTFCSVRVALTLLSC